MERGRPFGKLRAGSRQAGPFDFPLDFARGFGKTGQARETPVSPSFVL